MQGEVIARSKKRSVCFAFVLHLFTGMIHSGFAYNFVAFASEEVKVMYDIDYTKSQANTLQCC